MDFSQADLDALFKELDLILEKGWDYTFCVRKIRAVSRSDVAAYVEVMQEELAIKSERLGELARTGEICADIIERLRARIRQDEERVADLEDQLQAQEWKDVLITNLEAENSRLAAALESVSNSR
jgi:hypothetical protein